jgi:hypothetical protein
MSSSGKSKQFLKHGTQHLATMLFTVIKQQKRWQITESMKLMEKGRLIAIKQ